MCHHQHEPKPKRRRRRIFSQPGNEFLVQNRRMAFGTFFRDEFSLVLTLLLFENIVDFNDFFAFAPKFPFFSLPSASQFLSFVDRRSLNVSDFF